MAEPDRLLNRVETLVKSIAKIDAVLDANPGDPRKPRLLEARAQYQQSLRNIQEFGREKLPRPPGAKIEVPALAMKVRKE